MTKFRTRESPDWGRSCRPLGTRQSRSSGKIALVAVRLASGPGGGGQRKERRPREDPCLAMVAECNGAGDYLAMGNRQQEQNAAMRPGTPCCSLPETARDINAVGCTRRCVIRAAISLWRRNGGNGGNGGRVRDLGTPQVHGSTSPKS